MQAAIQPNVQPRPQSIKDQALRGYESHSLTVHGGQAILCCRDNQRKVNRAQPPLYLQGRELNWFNRWNPFRKTAEALPLICCQQQPPVPCQFDPFKSLNALAFSFVHLYYSSSADIYIKIKFDDFFPFPSK